MFDWFAQEIDTIKTRRFHIVDGPDEGSATGEIEDYGISLPRSYHEFVRRFGNARLFRRDPGCLLGVWVPPLKEKSRTGEDLYGIGHYQSDTAYLKCSFPHVQGESPVFEGDANRQVQVADSFEEWFVKRYKSARRSYGKQKWALIVAGPTPFSLEEQRIVEARKRFAWRVVNINSDRTLSFEVFNGSDMVLPYLSIGVNRRGGNPYGGIWLPVAHILPGQTGVVEKDVYSNLFNPSELELVPNPDPEPEDRDRYWEFKGAVS